MKYTIVLLAVSCCVHSIFALQSSNGDLASARPKTTTAADDVSTKKSRVVVPPEKARPISIPKAAIGINIDGRIDEEAWKQAAVFKDFIQTGPGDNVAPSRPTEAVPVAQTRPKSVARAR